MPEREIIAFSSEPLVGTLLGIAGIVMAIYFYFKSRQFSRLALQTHEIAVIGGRTSAFDDHLEIRFGGEIVDRVTMTRSVLWNAGNVTIEGNKIVSSDPLRFQVNSENKILKIDIILQTRSVNDINFKRVDQNILLVDFDFIDPKDGITVEITHSGTIGEIKLLGTIRGIPNILSTIGTDESFIRVMQNLPKNFEKFSLMLTAGIGIFMVII